MIPAARAGSAAWIPNGGQGHENGVAEKINKIIFLKYAFQTFAQGER